MGQAKQRGSREERIVQSVERQRQERAHRELQKAQKAADKAEADRKRIAALPPETRLRVRDNLQRGTMRRTALIGALGLVMAAGAPKGESHGNK